MSTALTDEEVRRYSRQLLLPELGMEGQARLKTARVLMVGVGGLGSPAALYLAAAGVGSLVLVDYDVVDETNLQRQVLYASNDVGRSKLFVARERLRAINPNVDIQCVEQPLAAANAGALVEGVDLVVDGADNFPTRYLVNDACVIGHRPNVFGSILRFEGQASVFAMPDGPCYRCLHPEPPPEGVVPSCAEAGVLGVLPGFIGIVQATEAVKVIARLGEPLVGRMLLYDALRMRIREIALPKDPDCPVCGVAPTIRSLTAYERTCGVVDLDSITVEELGRWRATGVRHTLIDVRESWEHATSAIEGAMLMPLGDLARHLSLVPADRPVIVHCQTGRRSARATDILRNAGIDARNLTGGIDAWFEHTGHGREDPQLRRISSST